MRYTTKTEYGIVCLINLARRGEGQLLTIKEIAESEHYSLPYLEKILQSLRASNIVVSHQGNQGGYTLARHPSQVTLREIVVALEGDTFDVFCEPVFRKDIVCTHLCVCGVTGVWEKTKRLLDSFFGSITLEMITNNQEEMEKVTAEVRKNFSI